MNITSRKSLPGTSLQFFNARAAVEALQPGAWNGLPYVSWVLAENLVRRCEPDAFTKNRAIEDRRNEDCFRFIPKPGIAAT
ncbi:MAG: hypothetical protein K0M70_00710 [Arenimonas sp.]|uniref:hypothetical protein n=1 Tax=Arenimonas sp. TaxID=1872635 RepID=UPI0025C51367|nr:hypothetical protein [Arenimonas sp.]MBW8366369.1 hypothetical protein [Arenimonas sp.]